MSRSLADKANEAQREVLRQQKLEEKMEAVEAKVAAGAQKKDAETRAASTSTQPAPGIPEPAIFTAPGLCWCVSVRFDKSFGKLTS